MTPAALRLLWKYFIPSRKWRGEKNLPIDGVCLLAFGCLSKLIFRGEKNAWIWISCCCGKVNEKGANRKSRGSTLSQGFYDCPYVLCPRPNRFILLKMRQAVCSWETGDVYFFVYNQSILPIKRFIVWGSPVSGKGRAVDLFTATLLWSYR